MLSRFKLDIKVSGFVRLLSVNSATRGFET
jgi:hypothetical protein